MMNAGQPTLAAYLILGAMLFSIGVVGVFLNRKNVIILLMAIELLLLFQMDTDTWYTVGPPVPGYCRYSPEVRRVPKRRLAWRYWSPISAIAIASMWMISTS